MYFNKLFCKLKSFSIKNKTKKKIKILEESPPDKTEKKIFSVMLKIHAAEKIFYIKSKFSSKFINSLKDDILTLLDSGISPDSYPIRIGLSVLTKIYSSERLKDKEEELKSICEKYNVLTTNDVGAKRFEIDENELGLLKKRKSVRQLNCFNVFDDDLLINITERAKFAPSSCNRQPWKIYYYKTTYANDRIKKYIPDRSTAKNIPYFLIITVDRSMFNGEIRQAYINGGIFTYAVALALTEYNIGNCIFQATDKVNADENLRIEANIAKNHLIVSFIGYGEIPKNAEILFAPRKNAKEILIRGDIPTNQNPDIIFN